VYVIVAENIVVFIRRIMMSKMKDLWAEQTGAYVVKYTEILMSDTDKDKEDKSEINKNKG